MTMAAHINIFINRMLVPMKYWVTAIVSRMSDTQSILESMAVTQSTYGLTARNF